MWIKKIIYKLFKKRKLYKLNDEELNKNISYLNLDDFFVKEENGIRYYDLHGGIIKFKK